MISTVKNQSFANWEDFSSVELFVEQFNNMIASIAEEIMDGYHEYRTDEGEFYGLFRDKKPEGPGRVVVPFGSFIGTFQGGFPFQGTMELVTSTTIGFFKNGKRNGKCYIRMLGDELLQSKVREDNTLHFSDLAGLPKLEVYDGECQEGDFHGKGKSISEDECYEGSFKNSLRHGYGVFTRGKYRLEGEWVEGEFTGKGKRISEDGTVSEGTFNKGKLEQGRFKKANGAAYIGSLLNGSAHGKGEFTDECGTVYKGIYKEGELTGGGSYKEKDGSFYQGNFLNGMRHGKGKYTVMHEGKITDEYDGSWKEDIFHGFGTHKYGMFTEKGNWVDGKKEGEFETTITLTKKTVYPKEGKKE